MSQVFPINADPRFRIYIAEAGQVAFPVPFPWQDNDDITILRTDLEGVTTTLNEAEHYQLTGAGNVGGGTMTLNEGEEALEGEEFLILGDASLVRVSSIVQGGRFRYQGTDNDLDRLTLIAQEIHRELGRTLRTRYGAGGAEVEVGGDNTLPRWLNGRLVPGPVWGDEIGIPGPGLPPGGLPGQVPVRIAGPDYTTEWQTPASTAALVSFNPAVGVGATNVQGAIEELAADAMALSASVTADLATKQPVDASLTAAAGKFSLNVQGTGRFGLNNTGGLMSFQSVAAPASGYGVAVRAQGAFAYTGGTPGNVNSPLTAITTVSAGVADYVWGVLSILTNSATAGQNSAAYFQGLMQSTGPTWGMVAEAIDKRHTADPTTGLVAVEIDIVANGTDSNNQRLGVHIVARRDDTSGAAMEAAAGINIDSSAAASKFKKGINFQTGSPVVTGIDLSGAILSGSAILLGDNHKLAFDTADTRSLYFDGTRLRYATAGNPNALRISDAGFVGVNVAPAVQFDAAGTGDTQLRLVDGATVDVRLKASAGSAVGFFGTQSNHDMVVITNSVEAFRILANGNVRPAGDFYKGTDKVVGTRKTGWSVATGTATRTTFATASVTLPQLAERVKALIDDLHATAGHGLIGT